MRMFDGGHVNKLERGEDLDGKLEGHLCALNELQCMTCSYQTLSTPDAGLDPDVVLRDLGKSQTYS